MGRKNDCERWEKGRKKKEDKFKKNFQLCGKYSSKHVRNKLNTQNETVQ
jgi:hypothetical protein